MSIRKCSVKRSCFKKFSDFHECSDIDIEYSGEFEVESLLNITIRHGKELNQYKYSKWMVQQVFT